MLIRSSVCLGVCGLVLVGCKGADDINVETGLDETSESGAATDTDTGTQVDGGIAVAPTEIDLGLLFVGQSTTADFSVQNVGGTELDITIELAGAAIADYVLSPVTSDPAPGESSDHTLTFTPTDWGNRSISVLVTESTTEALIEIPVTATVQIDADGDGYGDKQTGGDDCDDGNADINPGMEETWYDGVDADCAGDDDYDQDGDGVQVDEDCNDTDASIYPGAPDEWYDGVDSDCEDNDDYDKDGDGYSLDVDCDDEDETRNPGAEEIWYDGIDQDCDEASDYDRDGDGQDSSDYGGDDCDDDDELTYSGADEIWYDGIDQDCAGDDDYDQDGDGVQVDDDCDDTDADIGEPTDETFNGIDDDCDGFIDELPVSDYANGVITGYQSNLYIGNRGEFAAGGDIDEDGTDDVIITSTYDDDGYAWLVSGADIPGTTDDVNSLAQYELAGDAYLNLGHVVGPAVDLDSDSVPDILVSGYAYYSSSYAFGETYLVSGGSGLSGDDDISDVASASFEGDSSSSDFCWYGAGGDFDGDGTNDVTIGCPYDNDGGNTNSGNVGLFLGDGWSGTYDLQDGDEQIHGDDDYDYLGYSHGMWDVDGDGYADVIAGAPGNDEGGSNAGRAYIVLGSASASWSGTIEDIAEITIEGSGAGDEIGLDQMVRPGDVDGSGNMDMALTSEAEGEVYLFLDAGSLSGEYDTGDADHELSGTATDFGSSMVMHGDLDGDGDDDMAIGADGDDTSATDAGAVFLFAYDSSWGGSVSTTDSYAMLMGESGSDFFGAGMTGGVDLDGDGNDDLLIGAVLSDEAASDAGAIYFIPGF